MRSVQNCWSMLVCHNISSLYLKVHDYNRLFISFGNDNRGTNSNFISNRIVCWVGDLYRIVHSRLSSSDHVLEQWLSYFSAKQEDDEIVLQIVYLFHHLVLHESTRQQVTKQSRILLLHVHACQ